MSAFFHNGVPSSSSSTTVIKHFTTLQVSTCKCLHRVHPQIIAYKYAVGVKNEPRNPAEDNSIFMMQLAVHV